jgi:hypothetical protein
VSYRIVYQVDLLQAPASTQWEERLVRRPFEGRVLTFSQRPYETTSGGVGSESIDSALFELDGDAIRAAGTRVPSLAVGDEVLGTVLPRAVSVGVARTAGAAQTVLGRACTVYDISEPGAKILSAPTAESTSHECVDGDGLILDESWELKGAEVLHRRAVELDTTVSPAVTDAAFAVPSPPPAGGGLLGAQVAPVDQIDSFLEAPPVPEGFSLHGTYRSAVIGAQGPTASVAWVLNDAAGFVTVEAGTGIAPALDPTVGEPLTVQGIGQGRVVLGVAGATAVLSVEPGRWLRVVSSTDDVWLRDYLTRLRVR